MARHSLAAALNGDGGRWKLTVDEAIFGTGSGKLLFYVERPVGAAGRKYLRTTADGDQPHNQLRLPECP